MNSLLMNASGSSVVVMVSFFAGVTVNAATMESCALATSCTAMTKVAFTGALVTPATTPVTGLIAKPGASPLVCIDQM